MDKVATIQELEDDDDIELAKSGNKEAFGRLMYKYQGAMYRIARGILTSPQDMEDAAQNTVIKSFMNIKAVKNNDYFKSWLLKIVINECYNILRKKKQEVSMEEIDENHNSYVDTYANFELMEAVNSLEEEQKLVTMLFYYEDMSLKDIAKTLNLPDGTVKSRLSRAKKKLEKLMIS